LVRWGQELHDRFLLPFWMWRDFEDVMAALAARGVALPAEAYQPFVELRCPLVGTLEVGGGAVEVRNAIEPWHVLGQEVAQARARSSRRLVAGARRDPRARPGARAPPDRRQRRGAADAPVRRSAGRRRALPRVGAAARAAAPPRHPSPAAHRRDRHLGAALAG